MAHLEELSQIVDICGETDSVARFLMVYIQEGERHIAHSHHLSNMTIQQAMALESTKQSTNPSPLFTNLYRIVLQLLTAS